MEQIGNVIRANLQTLTKQQQQYSQALTPRTQNEALQQVQSEPSVFGNQPAASPMDVTLWTQRLQAAFPQMPSTFWGLVSKKAAADCLSRARLDYIEQRLTTEHQYATLTIADIFKRDIQVRQLSFDEVCKEYVGVPIACYDYNGKRKQTTIEEAERAGLKYEKKVLTPRGVFQSI